MSHVKSIREGINNMLWIAQFALATGLIWVAIMKLLNTVNFAAMWPWVGDYATLAKITGILDLFAGMGVILPSLFRIKPQLTVYAAACTAVLMISAIAFHFLRGEGLLIELNIFFAVMAIFIAWGRYKKVPLKTRNL